MKPFFLLLIYFLTSGLFTNAQLPHLVISQVYSAGGNTGASYNRDFVEIFNPTATSVSLTGYSIQYASAGGSAWTSRSLSGTVAANSYFLIQMTASGTNGMPIPTPDLIVTSTDMSATAGKLALVNTTTPLSGTCPTGAAITDFIGYGLSASCWEGTASAAAPSTNLNSIARVGGGCTDTDNNINDFSSITANPRNSASATNTCPSGTTITTGTISAPPFCISTIISGNGTVHFTSVGSFNGIFTAFLSNASGDFTSPLNVGTAMVSGNDPSGTININIPAGTPGGSGYRIRIDGSSPATIGTASSSFEIINGVKDVTGLNASQGQNLANISWINPNSCYNEILVVVKQGSDISIAPSGDGSAYSADANFNGAGTFFDGGKIVYKGTGTNVNISGLPVGDFYVRAFVRYGTEWSPGLSFYIPFTGNPNHLVISQVYGGGGNSGATYSNDFIELFNPTATAITLNGYSIQYSTATGNNWSTNKLDLNGTIAGYSYFLIQLAGGVNGSPLPSPDQTGVFNMSATNGKIALVNNTTPLTSNCPSNNFYTDFIGYGSTADCSEGGGNAPGGGNATALVRNGNGCTDTDNNAHDFSASLPAPRNSSSPVNNCFQNNGPLPVHFSFFRASERSGTIRLDWTNETEENLDAYIIERSGDGRNFALIGKTEPLKNDHSSVDYRFFDPSPTKENGYYRIKAVEVNGKATYSLIARIKLDSDNAVFDIYPNPVQNGQLTLEISRLPKGSYTIIICNTSGQEVWSRSLHHSGGAVTEYLPVHQLTKGLYNIRINGQMFLQKMFVVQ